MSKRLNVMYQSSSLYAVPTAISICSLFENNKMISDIFVWVIDAGLTEDDKRELSKLGERYGRKIEFYPGKKIDNYLKSLEVALWNGSYATFYKLFACCHLGITEPVLYFDADTLILGSLEQLCDFDFDNNAVAMVNSAITNTIKEFYKIDDYYNAGVVYFNVPYWIENDTEEKFIALINTDKLKKYSMIADETLINNVLQGKIKKLDLTYNYESSWWLWGWNKSLYPKVGFDKYVPYYDSDYIRDMKKPCIAHYLDLTTGRPWEPFNDNNFRHEFLYYKKLLVPWKEIEIPSSGIGHNNIIILFIKRVIKVFLPFKSRSNLGFMQHDKYWRNRVNQMKEEM